MASQTTLGSDIYLFLSSPGVFRDDLVISAHGGYDAKKLPTFAVPLMENGQGSQSDCGLFFYVEHGSLQTDFGLGGFAGEERKWVQHLQPGASSYNYALSKYQGKHNKAGESYGTIMRDIDAAIEAQTKYASGMIKAPKVYASKTRPRLFDVATIRNRFNGGDVMLRALLTRVLNVNDYPRIHCYFCRGAM
jgi:hypothetical protein